ncbi:hypothetical protein [Oculatella sp. LEGE 06141]|uniref:hypothetical protein n=1 Tax=Oculatella sp. LEGE 06141 TaxID=1828648 RepID=UPI0030DD73B1
MILVTGLCDLDLFYFDWYHGNGVHALVFEAATVPQPFLTFQLNCPRRLTETVFVALLVRKSSFSWTAH